MSAGSDEAPSRAPAHRPAGSPSRTVEILPDAVANQIAAGEVVERPASVVKELVENAFDAGAVRVDVLLEAGGKRRIRVADDGIGMGRQDALLALDRHATSKIREANDLREIRTFGFRGEALPSVASVSRLVLETAPGDGEAGTRIRAVGGTIQEVEDHPRARGTTVQVDNLFFNAPARAKFLRSTRAETRAVSDQLTALALANPTVTVTLASGERTLLDLARDEDVARRVADLWGKEAAEGLVAVAGRGESLEVGGLVQRPDRTRPGFRRAHLFVDGRPFRDRGLLEAAERGYRTTIPPDHRPWLFLYLRTTDAAVDVNVHPTKAEVRFRDRAAVEALVEDAVREAMEGEASAATFDRQLGSPRLQVNEPRPEKSPSRSGSARSTEDGGATGEGGGQMALFLSGSGGEGAGADGNAHPPEGGTSGPGAATVESSDPGTREGDDGAAQEDALAEPTGAELARLWQVHNSYIMAETSEGLLLIDQHAAHERVLFERILAGFEEGGFGGQTLLFPITIRLSPAEFDQVEELQGLLERTGYQVEGFGGDTVLVRAVPDPHPHFDPERCLREMIQELVEPPPFLRSAKNQHERVAMSFACKAAVKSGQPLDEREIRELFDQLFATQLPWHDVHGRPTVVRLSRVELERKFGR